MPKYTGGRLSEAGDPWSAADLARMALAMAIFWALGCLWISDFWFWLTAR